TAGHVGATGHTPDSGISRCVGGTQYSGAQAGLVGTLNSMESFMNKWFALAVLVLSGCQNQSDEIALGTLERDRVVLTATAGETITEVLAREGQVVQVGDVLLRLDDRRQRARAAQAEALLAQAQAHLTELQNGVREEEIAAAKARLEGATAVATAAANQ